MVLVVSFCLFVIFVVAFYPRFVRDSALRFVKKVHCILSYLAAFWFCVLVLRFVAAFWLCVLLIEDSLAFCLGKNLPVSKLGCVLCQDFVAFCLEDFLRFVSRPLRFVSRLKKDRYNADIRATNILLQGLPKGIYTIINHYTDVKEIWDNAKMLQEGSELTKEDQESQLYDDFEHFRQHKGESIHDYYVRFTKGRPSRGQGMNPRGGSAAGYRGAHNRVRNVNPGQARPSQARPVKCYNYNGIGYIARNCTQAKRPQNSEYYKDKMLLMQAQENGVALDAEQLLFLTGGQDNAFDDDVDEQPVQDLALNVDNVFQADNCDAFDSDMDEAPWKRIRSKRDKFEQNQAKRGSVAKPGKV
nr:retrovirus-related Pol polyprotein from transposon TNT 1-94 [Tanacetum cinerariifolium]